MTQYIYELYKHHLSSWFILPACGVNLQDFQSNGFLNTHISEDCTKIYVTVERHSALPARLMTLRPITLVVDSRPYKAYCIHIPAEFREDVMRYKRGKYTEFSETLKTIIVNHSGLSCLVQNDGNGFPYVVEMDLRLASLFSEHRQAMEEFLVEAYYNEEEREEGLEIFRSQTELLSKPKPGEFIKLVSAPVTLQ